ncbi:hypothetical protein Mic7113_4783 [Allocoleopsis franciscana PCC 7113]|uniref:Uncharacterized protein n=1 Tax=Allocoleopsis franciscana PCC 7113 TaxID=1173027 RepID=K9WJ69_9CYAN|nr:hypothetical protein Mic7113_4783 [Allocoleopsis franciscana PCC 7113]
MFITGKWLLSSVKESPNLYGDTYKLHLLTTG